MTPPLIAVTDHAVDRLGSRSATAKFADEVTIRLEGRAGNPSRRAGVEAAAVPGKRLPCKRQAPPQGTRARTSPLVREAA